MKRINTKSLVQGAMIAAMFGMLSIFNTYTGGMIDVLICYFMVVPIAWYGYQYHFKMNLIVMFVSIIVIFMFGTPFFCISSFSSCCIGVFLGEALKRKWNKEIILCGTLAICLINNILIYQVFSDLLGMNIIEEMTVSYNDIIGFFPQLQNVVSLDMALQFIPLLLLMMSAMEMYVIILICQLIFMRLKIKFPSNFHIATMHLSRKVGIVLAIGMIISYFLMSIGYKNEIVIEYISLLSRIGFILQGFSFVNFCAIVMKKRWLILISFLLFFIPFGTTIYIILGILDIFSDLRGNLLYNGDIK